MEEQMSQYGTPMSWIGEEGILFNDDPGLLGRQHSLGFGSPVDWMFTEDPLPAQLEHDGGSHTINNTSVTDLDDLAQCRFLKDDLSPIKEELEDISADWLQFSEPMPESAALGCKVNSGVASPSSLPETPSLMKWNYKHHLTSNVVGLDPKDAKGIKSEPESDDERNDGLKTFPPSDLILRQPPQSQASEGPLSPQQAHVNQSYPDYPSVRSRESTLDDYSGREERMEIERAECQTWNQERKAAFREYNNIKGAKQSFGVYLANIVRRQLAVKRAARPGVMTRSASHPAFKLRVSEEDFLWDLRQLNFDSSKEDTLEMEEPTLGRAPAGPSLKTFERYCFINNHKGQRKDVKFTRECAVHWYKGRMYTFRAEKDVPREAVFLSDVHKLVDVFYDYEGRSYDARLRFRGREAERHRPPGQELAYLPAQHYWNARNEGKHNPVSRSKFNPRPPMRIKGRTKDLLQDPFGRLYLDAEGETIIDHAILPLIIPSDVEEWRIRAMIAYDQAVTREDIMARMPCKAWSRKRDIELSDAFGPPSENVYEMLGEVGTRLRRIMAPVPSESKRQRSSTEESGAQTGENKRVRLDETRPLFPASLRDIFGQQDSEYFEVKEDPTSVSGFF